MKRIQVLLQHITGKPPDSNVEIAVSDQTSKPSGAPVFIGGLTMDIMATPAKGLETSHGGSVPGTVKQSPGGVGHNVALGVYKLLKSSNDLTHIPLPLFVSCVGKDLPGAALIQHWKSFGMQTQYIVQRSDVDTAAISIIFDSLGDVTASVADVAAVEQGITDKYLEEEVSRVIKDAPYVMLDGNLSAESIEAACKLAAENNITIVFEPVSAAKSTRATSSLPLIDYISPNQVELVSMAAAWRKHNGHTRRQSKERKIQQSLTGIQEIMSLHHDIATVLEAGVKNIILTLGPNGAVLCKLGESNRHIDAYYIPALPCSIINCSGAGDCLVSGLLFGLLNEEPGYLALSYGVAAAKCAVESPSNVPDCFDFEGLKRDALRAANSIKHFQLPFMPLM